MEINILVTYGCLLYISYRIYNVISKDKKQNENNKKLINDIKKLSPNILFCLLGICVMIYIDVDNNVIPHFGLDYIFSKNSQQYVLRVIGSYGIIQVLAQDLGIKTGTLQRDIIQNPLIQFIILFAAGFSITSNRNEAFLGTLVYYILKYPISRGKTSAVCFEDV